MTVADLTKLVADVAAFLTAAKTAKPVLDAVVAVRDGLTPFNDSSLDDFAGFLRRADEYRRTGVIPVSPVKGGRGPAAKPAGLTVAEASALVGGLYQSAATQPHTDDQLTSKLAGLSKLTKPQLVEVAAAARADGGAAKLTKPKVIQAIVAAIRRQRDAAGGLVVR